MQKIKRILLTGFFVFFADRECFAKAKPYVVFAATEFVGLPDGTHDGVYSTFGVAFEYKLPRDLSLTPAVLFEFSPELERWGFVGALTLDWAFHKRVGLDITISVAQDQETNHWSEIALYFGPYAGLSFFFDSVTFSVGSGFLPDVRTGNWVASPTATVLIPIGG